MPSQQHVSHNLQKKTTETIPSDKDNNFEQHTAIRFAGLHHTLPSATPPVQAMTRNEEEEKQPLQGKADNTIQRQLLQEEEIIKQKSGASSPNKTGMPDNLKTGIESLSGINMSDVQVHKNSSKPTDIGAHAFTQGTDIHLAPGQEQHLPHEAWHVVQQMQGRVQPTTNIGGTPVNDSPALEKEADVMGYKGWSQSETTDNLIQSRSSVSLTNAPVQGVFDELIKLAIQYGIPATLAISAAAIIGVIGTIKLILNCVRSGKNVKQQLSSIANKDETESDSIDNIKKTESELTSTVGKEESVSSGKIQEPMNKTVTQSLLEGVPGDCLYTAVNIALENNEGNEDAFRKIATQWLIDAENEHEIFNYADRDAMIDIVSVPQEWTGNAGDLSAVVLAYSLGITLSVVTSDNAYIFNPGHNKVEIYYHSNHYTSFPVPNVHDGSISEIVSKPAKKLSLVSNTVPLLEEMKINDSEEEKSVGSIDSMQEEDDNPDYEVLSFIETQELRVLLRGLGNQATLRKQDWDIISLLKVVIQEDRITRKQRRQLTNYYKFLSSPEYTELATSTTKLSVEDKFAQDYPNAIRIRPMDSVKTALKGTAFASHMSFVSSTFSKPSPNLPRFDGHTVYHDTQGGSGGGFTIFGVIVGSDKFLIAHGRHSSVKGVDYQINWVCASKVAGWDGNSVSFK